MAVGDEAIDQGLPIVPDSGENGRVRWGAREINRTRDYVARVMGKVPSNKAGYRSAAGIRSGTAAPSGGADGDIYLQIT